MDVLPFGTSYTTQGTDAVQIAPGQIDGSLLTGGSVAEVDDKAYPCLDDPDQCVNGISFSLWVIIYEPGTGALSGTVFQNGGDQANAKGYGFFYGKNGDETYFVVHRDVRKYHKYVMSHFTLRQWHHVAITVKDDNIAVYVDGCDARHYSTTSSGDISMKVYNRRLSFGGKPQSGGGVGRPLKIQIDHMLIWFDVLNKDEIWQIFAMGGMA